ncbi:type VII secretion integral membrane protein EccD [Dietzia sp. PP-33]|uniref:type VII secretion integral membrane protein EccD n=1 Tax=Dietzia sp. PP-33 TaxID=2957500 RepID=UPI0029AF1D99|nr:type VII secretion integral membrane protein EccD [Dietzia sp. PP-33]MDX2358093.1 type VII secretion integral membrane protein EccD [Dietzia sp. PP-33]
MTEQSGVRGVSSGVEPLDQRRVSIVCRTTRVDLSLPAHLELVAVIPEVVDLVRERIRATAGPASGIDVDARMGGGAGGSWQLSRLAGGSLAVSETLAQQRVHDGEILVLDHRPVPTPAPLFDDVLQGLTDPDVARSSTWSRRETVYAATATTGVLAVAAATAVLRQWWSAGGFLPPTVASLLALFGLAGVLALRGTTAPGAAHAVAGASAVGFTVLAAATTGSAPAGAGHLVGGLTAGAVLAGVLRCTAFRPGPPASYGPAAGYLSLTLTSAVGAVAAVIVASTRVPAHAAGAGALLAGLILLTAAPRIAVSAARIPIPPVPAPGEGVEAGDLEDIDHDVRGRDADDRRPRGPLPTPTVLRHRFLTSRSWLTGLLASAGTICAAGSLVSLTGGPGPTRWAAPLAVVLTMVLVLRGLGYADRVHTALLLGSALVLTAGVLVGAVITQPSPVGVVVPTAAAVAAAVVLAATVLPHVTFSPAALRAVGTIEAIGICVLVPLAVGAMDVYSLVRQR